MVMSGAMTLAQKRKAGKPMKRSKILLIDNDAKLSVSVTEYFHSVEYDVTCFADAAPALEHTQQRGLPHIALINMSLPSADGFDLARQLKSIADVPIIFLAMPSDKDAIVEGLKRFADDFIVKPFDMRELEARVEVVLARMPSFDYASEPIIHVDDNLSVDLAHNRIIVGGKAIGLTPTEAVMLHLLMRNANRVVENRTLIARVWPTEEVFEDTLRVHMHRLRRKIEADSHHPHYIRTERGVGYRFTQRPPLMGEDSD